MGYPNSSNLFGILIQGLGRELCNGMSSETASQNTVCDVI